MKAEYEERRKQGSVLDTFLGGGGGQSQQAAQPNPANFDLAGFLAGSTPKDSSSGTSTPAGGSKKKR
jgi:hypothetical protein